jgi:hypothetical protein
VVAEEREQLWVGVPAIFQGWKEAVDKDGDYKEK